MAHVTVSLVDPAADYDRAESFVLLIADGAMVLSSLGVVSNSPRLCRFGSLDRHHVHQR
jgi:hypothetical protein